MESESRLKESLIECDREKEELELKCTALMRETDEHSQTIRYAHEDVPFHRLSTADGFPLMCAWKQTDT